MNVSQDNMEFTSIVKLGYIFKKHTCRKAGFCQESVFIFIEIFVKSLLGSFKTSKERTYFLNDSFMFTRDIYNI